MIKKKMPEAVDKRMTIFGFKGFVRQVPVKKSQLKKFSDLCYSPLDKLSRIS